ncbi:MAG: hypothetical protein QME12_09155 [Nanoarchaeota archaeon]|nr:hypothetical protein [Nanoarchaeota archaeon]
MSKPIKVTLKFLGGKGGIIPFGAHETLTIEIIDEIAVFHFLNCNYTRQFANRENKDGVESKYIDRLKKTLCKYPGMKKEEILEHIKRRLEALECNKWKTNQ